MTDIYAGPDQLLRFGGWNPANLRPRPADLGGGLSVFDSYAAMAADYQRRGEPLITGDDYLVLRAESLVADFEIIQTPPPGHYELLPRDPTEYQSWMTHRGAPDHRLVQALRAAIIERRKVG